ncbi:MAG: class II aldolase/adducin family protein [Anaerolineae bacterium]
MSYDRHRANAAQTSERALRREMVRIGRLMHARGYVTATDGNISVRLDEERFLVTPSGLSKGYMTPEQMVVIDWEARPLGRGNDESGPLPMPSSEILLHLEAYRQRPDIAAVVHAHPVHAVVLSIAGIPLTHCPIPEVIVNLGAIPTTDYAMPASPEGATVIRELIRRYDALILRRHGSVTVGKTLWEAYLHLEKLENAAEITYRLLLLDQETPFPPTEIEKLLDKREKAGLMRPGQRAEIARAWGLSS